MATLFLKPQFSITLNSEELRLLLKALEGKLEDSEKKEASDLSTNLKLLKIGAVKSFADSNEKLAQNLK